MSESAQAETMTLALAQIEIDEGAVDANVARARDAIARGASRGADLVALPELFAVGFFGFDLYERVAQPLDGDILSRISDAAVEHDVAVLAGTIVEALDKAESVPVPATGGLANTAVLFDSSGERRLIYRKHHLFGYNSREAELLTPGEHLETADIGGMTVGVTTCYDLRFPELYRRFVDAGVELVLVPSAWPYPRLEHWETLSKARAIENQCYVATINGSGSFEEATLLGRTSLYDPWGVVRASSGDDPELVIADIDVEAVSSVREEFPALEDRRY